MKKRKGYYSFLFFLIVNGMFFMFKRILKDSFNETILFHYNGVGGNGALSCAYVFESERDRLLNKKWVAICKKRGF